MTPTDITVISIDTAIIGIGILANAWYSRKDSRKKDTMEENEDNGKRH